MSYPNPSAPKTLRRSRTDKFLGGVCGGVAEYLNMDPTLVRILTVVITLFTGVPIVAYLVAWLIMPEAGQTTAPPPIPPTYPPYPPAPGATAGSPAADDVWGPAGPPWEAPPASAPATPPTTPPTQEQREDGAPS